MEKKSDADQIIDKLGLALFSEEGIYVKRAYEHKVIIDGENYSGATGKRHYITSIYFLITPENFSSLHALKQTEMWHFYAGDPVQMVQITEDGTLNKIIIGNKVLKDQHPQVVVEPYIWQGTKLIEGGAWALLGCTVTPGFELEDYISCTSDEMIHKFPQHEKIIRAYSYH